MIHNHEVGGSFPPLATEKKSCNLYCSSFFVIFILKYKPFHMETFMLTFFTVLPVTVTMSATHDVQKRLLQHNAGRTSSTKSSRPWVLVYTEIYKDNSDATKRESEIKRMKSRQYLESLISTAGSSAG
jgi:putative endonuclease